jgi:hypothetical protein
MGFRKDLTGQKFGLLTVLEFSHNDEKSRTFWIVSCDCGSPPKVIGGRHLTSGKIKSCGCYRKNLKKIHGLSSTPEHVAWQNMIARCERPSHPEYYRYGGRGIKVCDEWRKRFDAFIDYIGPRPSKKHVLDRIDNNGNYEPDNVRWVTHSQSNTNRRYGKFGRDLPKGVFEVNGRFMAYLKKEGSILYRDYFETPEQAAAAYNEAA